MKKVPVITSNEWEEAIAATSRIAFKTEPDKVPPGWLDIWAIQKQYFPGLTVHHARTIMNAGLDIKFERQKFRVAGPTGQIRSVFHYRPKK